MEEEEEPDYGLQWIGRVRVSWRVHRPRSSSVGGGAGGGRLARSHRGYPLIRGFRSDDGWGFGDR